MEPEGIKKIENKNARMSSAATTANTKVSQVSFQKFLGAALGSTGFFLNQGIFLKDHSAGIFTYLAATEGASSFTAAAAWASSTFFSATFLPRSALSKAAISKPAASSSFKRVALLPMRSRK